MTKVYDPCIGARIPQSLMDKVKETGMSNTEIITNALIYYLNHVVNNQNKSVNKEIFENKNKITTHFTDRLKHAENEK